MRIKTVKAPAPHSIAPAQNPGEPTDDPGANLDLGAIGHKVSIKPREACDALSIGPTKLYELLNDNELVSYREDGSRKILVSSIRAYIARRIAASRKATTATMLLLAVSSELLTPTQRADAVLNTEPLVTAGSCSEPQLVPTPFVKAASAGRLHDAITPRDLGRA
jgi:hypothetical protein